MLPTYQTLFPLQLLLFLGTALAQYTFVDNFYWQNYTDCEASCLTDIFNTQQCTLANTCNSNDCMTLDDSCLCGTSSWLTAVSQCIGKSCGASAVYGAAASTSNECSGSMSLSEDKIIKIGLAAAPSTSHTTSVQPTASLTTTPSKPTSSSTAPSNGGSGGLSTNLQIIIGVVTSIVGVVVAIVGVFFAWKTYKHSKHTGGHTTDQHHTEAAASSTTALIPLPAGRTGGSISEEETFHTNPPPRPPPVSVTSNRS